MVHRSEDIGHIPSVVEQSGGIPMECKIRYSSGYVCRHTLNEE